MEIPEVFQSLNKAINDGQTEEGVAEARNLVESGYEISEIFERAIVPGLMDIGDRFARLEIFLPEMMFAAEVVKAIHQDLADSIDVTSSMKSLGRIVIGTAFGDIHDLGKNIVVSILQVNGFDIYDLGVNVEPQVFVRKAREVDADIIAISSLLMSSIPYISDVIDLVRGNDLDRDRFKIMVGGGSVTSEVAKDIGADAYGDNAADAVMQARALIGDA